MSTYTLYYQPPMVHAPTTNSSSATTNPNPTIQLHGTKQTLYTPTPPITKSLTTPSQPTTIPTPRGPLPMNPQSESPFFRLPTELRDQIYTYLLCPDAVCPSKLSRTSTTELANRGYTNNETLGSQWDHHSNISTPLHPAILSTCQRIQQEAEPLSYTPNIFHAHPALLTSLPHSTTPARTVLYNRTSSQIKRWQLSSRLDIDPRFTYEQAKAAFSGAEYLEIRVWQAQFEACDYSVLKLFAGVRGIRVARVGGSVDEGLARWLEGVMMMPEHLEPIRGSGSQKQILGAQEEGECECCGKCPGFEGRQETLCGTCYKKETVEWVEKEWDLWRFGK